MMEILLICLSLALVALCGVFVAAEFSFITVNRTKVEKLARRGDVRAAGVAAALRSLSTQLSGAQIGITITNLCIGFLAEPAIAQLVKPLFENTGVPDAYVVTFSVVIGMGIATAFTMVFGELVPKNFALARPIGTAKAVQGIQRQFTRLTGFLITILNGSANGIVKKFGVVPHEELASARSADELASIVQRSAEQGTLPRRTALILSRSFEFDSLTALDVMTPRTKIVAVHAEDALSDVIDLTKQTGRSRFPVCGESMDTILGVVHVKQALGLARSNTALRVKDVMSRPLLVPSTIQLDSLLEKLRRGNMQIAVVVDEFGGTDGIVTIEDLLEELVGEVYDEHDLFQRSFRKRQGGGWVLSGRLRPDEIGEEIGIYLPEEDVETIGGLVSHYLEKIPETGDSVDILAIKRNGEKVNVQVKVIRMDGMRVDTVQMVILGVEADQ